MSGNRPKSFTSQQCKLRQYPLPRLLRRLASKSSGYPGDGPHPAAGLATVRPGFLRFVLARHALTTMTVITAVTVTNGQVPPLRSHGHGYATVMPDTER
jgi:hypothetical protein